MIPSLRAPRFTLRLAESGKFEDPHRLMRCLYVYWFNRGYWGVVTAALVDVLNMLALMIVAVIFSMRFHWEIALHCTEAECAESVLVNGWSWPYVFQRTFWGYMFGFVFVASTTVSFLYETIAFAETVYVYREVEELAQSSGIDTGFLTPFQRWQHTWRSEQLAVGGHESVLMRITSRPVLTTINWGDFMESVCEAVSRERLLMFCSSGDVWDSLRAVQALMQHENFAIAMYDSDLLRSGALSHMSPETLLSLMSATFDPFNTISARGDALWAMRERTVKYITLSLCFYAFIATYSVVKVLTKNAAQLKSNYSAFSQLEWNHRASWTFRLYNEVTHLHESRLAVGRTVASRMVCRLSVSNSVSRFVRRVSSICVLVTVTLTFLNPALFIGGSVGGLTFVWWLTIALLLHATFTEVPASEREYAYVTDLEQLCASIHYSTEEWYQSGEAFLLHIKWHFVCSRFALIFTELFRILFMPFILMTALRDGSLESLVDFLLQNSVFVEGVGSVAQGAAFERDATGEEQDAVEESSSRSTLLASSNRKPRGEKLRCSVASFSAVYPRWTLQHLDRAAPTFPGPDALAAEAHHNTHAGNQSTTLASFLSDLNDRVSQQVLTLQPRYGGETPGDLLVSQSRSTRTAGIPFEVGATAHEREKLFVSQVMHARSGLVPTERYGASRSTTTRTAADGHDDDEEGQRELQEQGAGAMYFSV